MLEVHASICSLIFICDRVYWDACGLSVLSSALLQFLQSRAVLRLLPHLLLNICCAHEIAKILHILLLLLKDNVSLLSFVGELLFMMDCMVLLEAFKS